MIEVIKDKSQWNAELSLIKHLDVYHTYDYHHISKNEDDIPILLKYTDGNTTLLLPLLFRPIENTGYNDATSVYGYAGLLTANIDKDFDKRNFQKELHEFFIENKIVSVFSRLHPYIKHQETPLEGLGSITALGQVVYIDLNDTLEDQRKMFNRRMKTYLNKSRKICTVIESKREDHLQTFMELYRDTMTRVNADKRYFFSDEYFKQLMSSKDFEAKLLLNIHNESQSMSGGALFLVKGNFVQYHLSALNEDFHDLNSIKLIIDEMRIKSTNSEFDYLNLGGGRGSNEDSLFAFKSNFSKKFKDFKIWKYIVNEKMYDILVQNHLKESTENEHIDPEFFPAYRSSVNIHS